MIELEGDDSVITHKITIFILLLAMFSAASGCGFFLDDNTAYTASITAKATTKTSSVTARTEAPTLTAAPTPDTRLRISLSYNTIGGYGKIIVMDEGTELERNIVAFYIPSGTYSVKNMNKSGSAQVTVYSGIGNDGQWDEFYSDNCDRPIVVFAGDLAKTIVVKEGQFIKLSDGSSNIEFIKTE